MRSLALLALAAAALAGCRTPTEIVVRLEDVGGDPAQITVKLHRSVPFDANAQTPAFVESVLDGADLDLLVTPQGASTTMSLLPPKNGPNDLTVSVSAPGFEIDPPDPQSATFEEHASKELKWTLTAIPPDMAHPVKDGGVKDAAADGNKGG